MDAIVDLFVFRNEPTQSATYKLVQEMDEDEKRYGSS